MEAFRQQLEKMDQTASQKTDTEDEKDETIRQLRIHVAKLKELLLAQGDTFEMKSAIDKMDGSFVEPSGQTQFNHIQLKKADEDPRNVWKQTCGTCNAERQAVVSAIEWFDKTTVDDTEPDTSHKQVQSERKRYFCLKSLSYHIHDELQEVYTLLDLTFWENRKTTKYIIHLHPTLCVNHLCYNTNNIHACGLITLQFARKTDRLTPGCLVRFYDEALILKNEVYEIVKSAIQEGSELYRASYSLQAHCLSAAEIVFLNRHLGLQLIEDIEIESMPAYAVTSYIMNLKAGQILLFIRMNKYNVWSAVRSNNEDIIIFDCQSTVRDGRLDGGMIYHVYRDAVCVMRALMYIEDHSGGIEGTLKLALVQT